MQDFQGCGSFLKMLEIAISKWVTTQKCRWHSQKAGQLTRHICTMDVVHFRTKDTVGPPPPPKKKISGIPFFHATCTENWKCLVLVYQDLPNDTVMLVTFHIWSPLQNFSKGKKEDSSGGWSTTLVPPEMQTTLATALTTPTPPCCLHIGFTWRIQSNESPDVCYSMRKVELPC